MNKTGEVQFRLPVQRPPAISGKVDESLIERVVRGGVRRDQVVTDIRRLHPRETGLEFVETKHWYEAKITSPAARDRRTFRLFGPLEINDAGIQTIDFITSTGETILSTRTGQFMQTIRMDADGHVTSNTGKRRIKATEELG